MSLIDFEKFTKYSKAGPRYTSYPTAIEFSENYSYDDYIERLKNQDSSKPLSLYFHLPFCRSACYFCGCNVVYTSKEDKKVRYLGYIKRELELLREYVDVKRRVIQLHFGGGTPTFYNAEHLQEIISAIKSTFPNFSDDAELSCEIDPRFIDSEQMSVLSKNGFNRVSFGVQDFDERVQKAVHRVQSFNVCQNAVDIARNHGMKSVNIDLIYGLPYQSYESFQKTLELARRLDPDRLAVFNYAHVPWMKKTMRKIDETTLPAPSEKLQILKYTIDNLTSNGYEMVGMDHFAKPDDELFLAIKKGELHRNFQGYTTRGGADLIGVGLTSIGEGDDHYPQNYKSMAEYEAAIDANRLPFWRGVELNEDDIIRKAVIMELMSNFKLNIPRIEERFSINFADYFRDDVPKLQQMVEDELLAIDKKSIIVSKTGEMLIRNISMAFDAYSKDANASKRTFSKTI